MDFHMSWKMGKLKRQTFIYILRLWTSIGSPLINIYRPIINRSISLSFWILLCPGFLIKQWRKWQKWKENFLGFWEFIMILLNMYFLFPWCNPSFTFFKQNGYNANPMSNYCSNFQTPFIGFCLKFSMFMQKNDQISLNQEKGSNQMDKISGCNCEDVSTRHNARALALNQRFGLLDAFKPLRSQPLVVRCILLRCHFAARLRRYQNRPITALPFSRASQHFSNTTR